MKPLIIYFLLAVGAFFIIHADMVAHCKKEFPIVYAAEECNTVPYSVITSSVWPIGLPTTLVLNHIVFNPDINLGN